MALFRLSKLLPAFVLIVSILGAYAPSAHAAGGVNWPNVRLTASAASATANGSSAITVTATFYLYECNDGSSSGTTAECDQYGEGVKGEKSYAKGCPDDTFTVNLNVAGDATLSKSTVCSGTTASDTFTVKSSVAGTKTITPIVGWSYSSATKNGTPVTVSFVAPVAAPAPKPKAPVAAPAPAPAPVVEKPAVPTVATIIAGDETVKSDQPISITTAEPLVLNGKTVPNGKVAVYVFSEPKLFETTADAEGNWSVKVEGLPEGNHHAEVEVTNPANNQKSDRTKFLEFSVVAAVTKATPNVVATTKAGSSKKGIWVGAGIVAVLLVGVAFWIWRRRQLAKRTTMASPAITPPSSGSSSSSEQVSSADDQTDMDSPSDSSSSD